METETDTYIGGRQKSEYAPKAKEHQKLPANIQKAGDRHGIDAPSQHSEGTNPDNILILDFWPPEV